MLKLDKNDLFFLVLSKELDKDYINFCLNHKGERLMSKLEYGRQYFPDWEMLNG